VVAPAAVGPHAGSRGGHAAAHRATAGPWEDRVTASSPATDAPPARYDDVRALVINCTLKCSPGAQTAPCGPADRNRRSPAVGRAQRPSVSAMPSSSTARRCISSTANPVGFASGQEHGPGFLRYDLDADSAQQTTPRASTTWRAWSGSRESNSRSQLGKPGCSRGGSCTDLRRSGVGAWRAVDWFPGVPRGSPHDLARVWHGPLHEESSVDYPMSSRVSVVVMQSASRWC